MIKLLAIRLAILAGLLFSHSALAGGGDVVVVYNSALPESKTVAEHYAQARQVPENHLFGFSLPKGLEISRADFTFDLQRPLADALSTNGLWKYGDIVVPYHNGVLKHTDHLVVSSQIRYLVLCYGVPLRIQEDPDLHEYGESNYPAGYRLNTASVDSELAWLPVINMHPTLVGPMQNWVYGSTNESLLSPTNGILPVSRLDGPTPEIASGLVDKAMAAERDGLWGRAYFDTRNIDKTDKYYYGDELIFGAAEVCTKLGYEINIDTNSETYPASFPMSHIAVYCGWYDWNADGPFGLPHVEFMPGAFAYHLHSFSAADIRSFTNNWVGPLLAKGATCTMGCVNEPYLQFTPNIAMFLNALAKGWTFGEAAWSAQAALSWQTTVVGDPLYRPFAKSPLERFRELRARHSPYLEWAYLSLMNQDLLHGAPVAKVAGFLDQLPESRQSAVISERLAELAEIDGRESAAIDYDQRALTLNPSPQQRIRLRLTLGDELMAQDRLAAARDNYHLLLSEAPDYAGKTNIEAILTRLDPQPAKSENH